MMINLASSNHSSKKAAPSNGKNLKKKKMLRRLGEPRHCSKQPVPTTHF